MALNVGIKLNVVEEADMPVNEDIITCRDPDGLFGFCTVLNCYPLCFSDQSTIRTLRKNLNFSLHIIFCLYL